MKKYLLRRRNSIGSAWTGFVHFFTTEAHAALHLVAALLVFGLAWFFEVTRMEWIVLIIAVGLVVQIELVNTVIERVADFMQPGFDPRIKLIKDIAAAAVLWSSVVAAVIGGFVFLPYIIEWALN